MEQTDLPLSISRTLGQFCPNSIPLCSSEMDPAGDSPDSLTHHRSGNDKATLEAQTHVNGGIHNLPEEIIVEILTRLPVKSLLRFRCVSKSWLTLISSKQFIKTHLKFSRQDGNLSNYRIMLTIVDPTFDLKHCPLSSLMYEPSTDACSNGCPNKHPQAGLLVVVGGSCNGLICLVSNEKKLFLWNPSTGKSKKLPAVNVNTKRSFCRIYGLGYNECDDDYKAVIIFCVFGYVSMVKIYSLKTNSWRRMEDLKGVVPLVDDSGKFASGKLHWLAFSELGSDLILSLDMESELYGIVEQPNYGEGEFHPTLGVLGECICILCDCEIRADLWVLKEHGVKESWTKVATVPYVDISENWFSIPLLMLRNGEILLVFGMHFVAYNPKDNSFRIHEISNLKSFHDVDIYVESLVSPVANGR